MPLRKILSAQFLKLQLIEFFLHSLSLFKVMPFVYHDADGSSAVVSNYFLYTVQLIVFAGKGV